MNDTPPEISAMSDEDIHSELAALAQRQASLEGFLAQTTKAYKKVRQMRGPEAHKRGWSLEERMKNYQAELGRLADREAALGGELQRRL